MIAGMITVATTVDRAWQTLSHRSSRHQLANFLPPQLIVPGFALKLEQLFTNIFHNALDATPPDGTITVYGHKDQDQVIITVSDQGKGMDHEQRELAMDPFYTTKDAGHGSGLGLSICYGIMIEHGGEINLLPRPDGRGTTVKLVFPVDLPGFRQKHERGEVTTHDQDSDRR
ncbi:sensor histidine kinase [Desulfurivibrio dismutans]|uniref:sensor histidine kinase n=1 Tax=Desulfurivibrio dismutans TaxID=1398908 RepID=UPI0023DAA6D0|nr:HAMP domain-containing sensor histidine kinase [Desulfurivibrio alkaliphilus]MDF1613774.1 HAMP domain-containing sensor histidine kinase [Desulfurivibrio alkaliphilus]